VLSAGVRRATARLLSPSQTRTRGTTPNASMCAYQPAYTSSAQRVGTNTADAHREYPQTIVNTGNLVAVRDWPNPTVTSISGNQKSHWATSPSW